MKTTNTITLSQFKKGQEYIWAFEKLEYNFDAEGNYISEEIVTKEHIIRIEKVFKSGRVNFYNVTLNYSGSFKINENGKFNGTLTLAEETIEETIEEETINIVSIEETIEVMTTTKGENIFKNIADDMLQQAIFEMMNEDYGEVIYLGDEEVYGLVHENVYKYVKYNEEYYAVQDKFNKIYYIPKDIFEIYFLIIDDKIHAWE